MSTVWFTAGSGKRSFDLTAGGGSVVIGRSEDATLDDGQVFELGERVTCPSCTESERLKDMTETERRMVETLAAEGYRVEGKMALSRAVIPVYKARRMGLDNLVLIKALPVVSGVS